MVRRTFTLIQKHPFGRYFFSLFSFLPRRKKVYLWSSLRLFNNKLAISVYVTRWYRLIDLFLFSITFSPTKNIPLCAKSRGKVPDKLVVLICSIILFTHWVLEQGFYIAPKSKPAWLLVKWIRLIWWCKAGVSNAWPMSHMWPAWYVCAVCINIKILEIIFEIVVYGTF